MSALVLLFMVVLDLSVARARVVKPVVLRDPTGHCLSQDMRDVIVQNIKTSVYTSHARRYPLQ